jgi:hypothetical protein
VHRLENRTTQRQDSIHQVDELAPESCQAAAKPVVIQQVSSSAGESSRLLAGSGFFNSRL